MLSHFRFNALWLVYFHLFKSVFLREYCYFIYAFLNDDQFVRKTSLVSDEASVYFVKIDSEMGDRSSTVCIEGYLAKMYKLQKLFSKALRSKDNYVLLSGTDRAEKYGSLFRCINVLAFPMEKGGKTKLNVSAEIQSDDSRIHM
jgi:hypothetical protein